MASSSKCRVEINLLEQGSAEFQESVCASVNITVDQLRKDVQVLREWLNSQPHLPHCASDTMLTAYLLACKNRMERAKEKIDNYYTARNEIPDFFNDRDPTNTSVQECAKEMLMFTMPKLTPDGCRITVAAYVTGDVKKYDIVAFSKRLFAAEDIRMNQDPFFRGLYFVFDADKFSINHVFKLTPTLARQLIHCGQNVLPIIIKGVIFINAPYYMGLVLNIIKPFTKRKLFKRIHVHTEGPEVLDKYFPITLLPKDYGGNEDTSQQLNDAWMKCLEENRDWLLQEGTLKVDESKRVKVSAETKHSKATQDVQGQMNIKKGQISPIQGETSNHDNVLWRKLLASFKMSLAPITDEQRQCVMKDINYDESQVYKKLEQIKEWIKKQPHLPELPDKYADKLIRQMLIGTKLSTERAKYKIDMYFAMRHQFPDVFQDKDPTTPDIRESVDRFRYCILPELTPDGIRVVILSPNPDKDKRYRAEDVKPQFKRLVAINDARALQDEFCRGEYLVYDMRGIFLSHITELNWVFIQRMLTLIQEGLPIRIKKVIVIHAMSYAETALNLIKPAIKDKIKKRIEMFQGDHTILYKFIPQRILPSDFGGQGKSIEESSRDWQTTIESMRDFFMEDGKRVTNESKRPKDSPVHCGQMFGIDGTFNKLNID